MSRAVALVVLAVMQVADYLSTRAFLAVGVPEGNGVVRYIGVAPAKLAGLALVCLLAWRAKRLWPLWALCVFYGAVVAWNLLAAYIGKT